MEDLLKELISLVRQQNDLLEELVDTTKNRARKGQAQNSQLTQDDYDALDEEIDLDWWFQTYGEESLPARFMNRQGLPYSGDESRYMFKRLCEIAYVGESVNNGTHLFKYLGKVYCKREKNTLNCFACVPVK